MTAPKRYHLSPYTYTPDQLGMNGVALNSTQTSNPIDMRSRCDLKIEVQLTYGSGTVTAVNVTLQESSDNSTWTDIQSVSVAAGTATYSDLTGTKSVSGAKNYAMRFQDLNCRTLRFKISGTAAGASDTVVCKARVA